MARPYGPPIQSLPDSSLSDILRRVSEDTGDIQQTMVCRKWNELTATAQTCVRIERLDPSRFISEDALIRQLRRFAALTALKIDAGLLAVTDALMGAIMGLFPRLKSLRFASDIWTGLPGSFEVTNGCIHSFAALLGNLKVLEITGCPISSFPEGLSSLTQIEELAFGTLEEDFSRGLELPNLKSLRLDFAEHVCQEIPGPIAQLTRLTSLHVEGGLWVTQEIGDLTSLVSLQIRAECDIPHTISSLVGLTNLHLKGSGSTPIDAAWLRRMSALETLHIDKCMLDSPADVSELTTLTKLRTDASYMAGCSQLSALTALIALSHETPELWGYICQLTTLRAVEIYHSIFPVPSRLGSLRSLRHLMLEHNTVADELPSSIGELRHLTRLSVKDFEQLLSLPNSISALSTLEFLLLDGCPSFDCLPDAISELCSLKSLILDNLPKLEEIPASVGALRSLTQFELTHWRSPSIEQFVQLPQTLTLLTALRELTILHCPAKCIPDGLASLPFLKHRCRKQLLDAHSRKALAAV